MSATRHRNHERAAVLPVSFFEAPSPEVARALLGKLLVSTIGGLRTVGRIVETEAYLGTSDPASHGFSGRVTPRTAALFGTPATWYVYRSYGLHWCCNLVCAPAGHAVLLRAVEPIEGLDVMRTRRGPVPDRALCAGPGRLSTALGITRDLDGLPMPAAPARIHDAPEVPADLIVTTARIGLTRAVDDPLRYIISGTPTSRNGK